MTKKSIFIFVLILSIQNSYSCTNFLVGKNATLDGSTLISYNADSYFLFGALYHYPAATYPPDAMLDIHDWDTGKYLGKIKPDACYTSTYLRCLQSVKIVENYIPNKFVKDERIRELRSDTKGFIGFTKRVHDFIKDIETKGYSSVAVCTHGAVMAALKHLLIHGKFYYIQGLDFPSPGNLIKIKEKKFEIINFNR